MSNLKLPFLNPQSRPSGPPSAWAEFSGAFRAVSSTFFWFSAITILSAIVYWVGGSRGWGIESTFTTEARSPASLLDCLYFSVVTIATLGYGDYRPVGFGRVVAGIEVLFGLVLAGVFVSRLVSINQDRISKRLLRGQYNTEIQELRAQLSANLKEFRAVLIEINKTGRNEILYRARGIALSIARYWRYEAKEPSLGNMLPEKAAGRLLGDMTELLEIITKALKGKSRGDLHSDDLKALRNISEAVLTVTTVLSERLSDTGMRHSEERVATLVTSLRTQFELRRCHQ